MSDALEPRLEAADFAPDDFIMLRPALVRKMGGNVVGAMILTRIAYRCGAQHPDEDGHKWWRTNAGDLAEEVGLSEPQVRRAINALIKDQYLVSKVDNINGYDRTKSYRVNVLTSQFTKSSDGTDGSVKSKRRNRQIDPTDPSVLLSSKTSNTRTEKNIREDETGASEAADPLEPSGELTLAVPSQRPDVDQLCQHLAERIVANGCKPPKITKAWKDSARLLLDKDGRDFDKTMRLIDWCQDSEFWRSNVMSMSKFRERYDQLRLQALAEWEREHRPAPNRSGLVEAHGMMLTHKNAAMFDLIAELKAEEEQALTALTAAPVTDWMRELEGAR